MTTLGILASGRGSNCEAILRAIGEHRLDARVGIVLTDQPEAAVLDRARDFGVDARYLDPGRKGARLSPEGERSFVAALCEAGVEWVVLAGFMRIIGAPLLKAYEGRILNIHPSLLPAFPGLDSQKQALEYGVKIAGCTVHFVNEGVDTGPIIMQQSVAVDSADTVETLSERILAAEHTLYVDALRFVISGNYSLEGRRVVPQGD